MPNMEMEGRKIYYEVYGSGEPVFLLHHGFGCTHMWKNIYPALAEAGYQVILYDRRGYGRSDPGEDFRDFYVSERFRAESVDELGRLAGYLGLDAINLVGQCEGGVIALQFAARYPNRARSVVTSSTLCYSGRTMADLNREKFSKGFSQLDENLQDKLKAWHGEDRAEAFFEQFRSFGGAYGRDVFDLRPLLPRVTCPALVLYPDRSILFEVEQGLMMYHGLPQGELAVLPRCGHNTYEQRPAEYNHFCTEFLDRHRKAREDAFDPTKVCFG